MWSKPYGPLDVWHIKWPIRGHGLCWSVWNWREGLLMHCFIHAFRYSWVYQASWWGLCNFLQPWWYGRNTTFHVWHQNRKTCQTTWVFKNLYRKPSKYQMPSSSFLLSDQIQLLSAIVQRWVDMNNTFPNRAIDQCIHCFFNEGNHKAKLDLLLPCDFTA